MWNWSCLCALSSIVTVWVYVNCCWESCIGKLKETGLCTKSNIHTTYMDLHMNNHLLKLCKQLHFLLLSMHTDVYCLHPRLCSIHVSQFHETKALIMKKQKATINKMGGPWGKRNSGLGCKWTKKKIKNHNLNDWHTLKLQVALTTASISIQEKLSAFSFWHVLNNLMKETT